MKGVGREGELGVPGMGRVNVNNRAMWLQSQKSANPSAGVEQLSGQ